MGANKKTNFILFTAVRSQLYSYNPKEGGGRGGWCKGRRDSGKSTTYLNPVFYPTQKEKTLPLGVDTDPGGGGTGATNW